MTYVRRPMAAAMNQKDWIRVLEAHDWSRATGGKHQVEMTMAFPTEVRGARMRSVAQSRDMTVQVHFEAGTCWATVDEFPGLFAAGDTERELYESVADGLRVYLAEGGREPQVTLLDVIDSERPPASRTVRKTLITA